MGRGIDSSGRNDDRFRDFLRTSDEAPDMYLPGHQCSMFESLAWLGVADVLMAIVSPLFFDLRLY